MASVGLYSEVQYLKGIGPRLAESLHKLGIQTVDDLLRHLPRRYEDRRNLPRMSTLKPMQFATVRGRLLEFEARPTRGGKVLLRATIGDGSGVVSLTWFNQPWLKKKFSQYDKEVIAYGQLKESSFGLEINSPEFEILEEGSDSQDFSRIVAIYPLTEGVHQWIIRKAVDAAIDNYLHYVVDPYSAEFRKAQGNLAPLAWSFREIHRPETETHARRARERLVFDELFGFQLSMQMERQKMLQEPGIAFDIAKQMPQLWAEVESLAHFKPTNAQRRVIEEIWNDMDHPNPMNRLLQGDVGSGKTYVAAAAILAACRNGYQAAILAPTEILAEQHATTFERFFEGTEFRVVKLLGRQRAKERSKALESISNGEGNIVVGTHAMIQEGIEFSNLGLAIIDEQHRFGVLQRLAMRKKGLNPDVLVMTATPIPRTLTMTVYGDLDVSVIDELPPGRSPIKTYWKSTRERESVYRQVEKLVKEGHQAYFICPMITESEKMQVQAAVDLHYRLATNEFKELRVGLLHGQMKPEDKEEVIASFRKRALDILVSTVVVEVGVDVPSATIMVIEDANRFGLSQLHQLRGRVGRGAEQSYCILIADRKTDESQKRLEVMVATSDGFKIAEADWEIRGPGEIAGTSQSGNLDFKIADLVRDTKLVEVARRAALSVLENDPQLARPESLALRNLVKTQSRPELLATVS